MAINLDGLKAAKESLVRAMDPEGAAAIREAIEALGGPRDPGPAPGADRAGGLAGGASPLVLAGAGVLLPDPAIEGAWAMVVYLPDRDRFAVFRGAVEDGPYPGQDAAPGDVPPA